MRRTLREANGVEAVSQLRDISQLLRDIRDLVIEVAELLQPVYLCSECA